MPSPPSAPAASIWPLERDCPAFYGSNRRMVKGVAGPSVVWERASLVTVSLPWRGVASWDKSLKIKAIRIHTKAAPSLAAVLAIIWDTFGRDQAAIERAGMHLIGGGYVWRAKRRGSTLSMHAYGAAVDFDPDRNGLGDATPAMDARVIAAFEDAGWTWGGRWSPANRDGMHFQAARIN